MPSPSLPRPRPGAEDPPPTSVRNWFTHRAQEVRHAPAHGWRFTATWIKAAVIIAATLAALLLLRWIGGILIGLAQALPWPVPTDQDSTGLLATIDQPIHRYLTAHTRALPVTAATAYTAWQAVGALALLLGFLRSSGARLTWTLWGAATVGMVWAGSPASGRPVAAGIALLAWAALSLLALRGLSLSPTPFVHVDVHHHTPHPPAQEPTRPPEIRPATYTPYGPHQPPSLN
ncbi:hypothetical protein QLX52_30640 [Streptomyces albus]|uniref:hypothetical protein n=1 Tax=Streptomyces albus TaxID=1888 RepID=UPI0024AE3E1B|nr:hypothetical protein [Streptomyces albus]MDI6413168.1 hypothetical protein [Streptomyces albus]